MVERIINRVICDNCPHKTECSILQNISDKLNKKFDFYIELLDKREYNKFVNLSITTAKCISQFEDFHSHFLNLIKRSTFDFDHICYYILDVKFRIWCQSIQTLSDVLKYMYIVYKRKSEICNRFRYIINYFLDLHKNEYELVLNNISHIFDKKHLSRRIIANFMTTHELLYKKFKQLILDFKNPVTNGDYEEYVRKYTQLLTQAMEITVVEVASINRLLVDNKVYVTSEVINWILEHKFNVLSNIKNVLKIPIKQIIYAEPQIDSYRYLFNDLLNRAS